MSTRPYPNHGAFEGTDPACLRCHGAITDHWAAVVVNLDGGMVHRACLEQMEIARFGEVQDRNRHVAP